MLITLRQRKMKHSLLLGTAKEEMAPFPLGRLGWGLPPAITPEQLQK
jgi:hypothetical protein